MSTQTINASDQLLKELDLYYQSYKKEKAPAYSLFQAKKNGVTVTAYHSGKVVFQGNGAEKEAGQWAKLEAPATNKKQLKDAKLPPSFESWSVLGSDEVGNGSYFGPITVCAAYVDQNKIKKLKELGVQDSKNLSDQQIQKLAGQIKSLIPYKLLVVHPRKYNEIQPQMSQHKMKALLHNQALIKVLDQLSPQKPQAILIDQFEEAQYYFAHIKQAERQVKDHVYFLKRAESAHLSVAAASIIARDQFLIEMKNLSDQAGFQLKIGANEKVDQQAAKIIQNPKLDLADFAKLHFANTKKAEKLAQP